MIARIYRCLRHPYRILQFLSRQLRRVAQVYRNLAIGQKLNLSFGLLALLTLVAVGLFFVTSFQARMQVRSVQRINFPLALESAQAKNDLLKALSYLRGYLATADSDFRNQYQAARQAFEQDLDKLTVLMQQAGRTDPTGSSHLKHLNQHYQQWLALPDQLFALRDDVLKNQPALALLQDKGEIPIATIINKTHRISQIQQQRMTGENVTLLSTLSNFETSFALMVAALRSYTVTQSPSFRFEYGAQNHVYEQSWEQLTQYQFQMTAEQQRELEAIEVSRAQFSPLPQQLFEIVESDRVRQDLWLLRNEAEPLTDIILDDLGSIVRKTQAESSKEIEASLNLLTTAQVQTLEIGLLSLLLSTVLALVLKRSIAGPINRLTRATALVAKGDLDVQVVAESRDEVGKLALAFGEMTHHLKQSHAKLEDYSRTLEQKVISRTQELQEKNQQIHQALTDLKKTQAQLIQTEKMSSLGQMVAGIAHEINNPVSFIHGNITYVSGYMQDLLSLIDQLEMIHPDLAGTIQAKADDIDLAFLREDFPKIMASMNMGTTRIRDIVLSLRNFSRLDEAHVKPVDIHEGCESTLLILQNRLKATAERPEIQVVRDYGNLPKVECHAGQINQVLMNLLANAIDALEEAIASPQWHAIQQMPTITLQTSAESDTATIVVADNGLGIPETVQTRLFEPFYTTKEVGKGTGMGLSISYQLITETHKGQLICKSVPGKGTRFIVQIPVKQQLATEVK